MWRDPSPHEVTINKTETGNYSIYVIKYFSFGQFYTITIDATAMIQIHTLVYV